MSVRDTHGQITVGCLRDRLNVGVRIQNYIVSGANGCYRKRLKYTIIDHRIIPLPESLPLSGPIGFRTMLGGFPGFSWSLKPWGKV